MTDDARSPTQIIEQRDFNRRYRQARLEARADGVPFPSYAQVRARLRSQIADGQGVDIQRLFEPSSR